MLNKGTHILEAVKALDDILRRTEDHSIQENSGTSRVEVLARRSGLAASRAERTLQARRRALS